MQARETEKVRTIESKIPRTTSVRNDEYVRDLVALSFSLLTEGGGAVKGVCGTYCKTGVQKRSFTRGNGEEKKEKRGKQVKRRERV